MKKLFVEFKEGFVGNVVEMNEIEWLDADSDFLDEYQNLIWDAMEKEYVTAFKGAAAAPAKVAFNMEVTRILDDAVAEALQLGDLEERHYFGLGEECSDYVTKKFMDTKAAMNRQGEQPAKKTALQRAIEKGRAKMTNQKEQTQMNNQTTANQTQTTKGAEDKMAMIIVLKDGEVKVGGTAYNKKYGAFTVLGSEMTDLGLLVHGVVNSPFEGDDSQLPVKLMAEFVSATPIENTIEEEVIVKTQPTKLAGLDELQAMRARMKAEAGQVVIPDGAVKQEKEEESSEARTEREAKELIGKQVSKEAEKKMNKNLNTKGLKEMGAKLGIKTSGTKKEGQKAVAPATSRTRTAAKTAVDQPVTKTNSNKGGKTMTTKTTTQTAAQPTTRTRKSAGAQAAAPATQTKSRVRVNTGSARKSVADAAQAPAVDRSNMKVNFTKATAGRTTQSSWTFDPAAPWYVNTMNREEKVMNPEVMAEAGWVNEDLGIQGVEFVDLSATMPTALGAVEIKLAKITLTFSIFASRQADSREPVYSPNAGYTKEEYVNGKGETKNRYIRHYEVSQFVGKDEDNKNVYENVVVPLGAFGVAYKDIDVLVAQAMVIAHWAFGYEL